MSVRRLAFLFVALTAVVAVGLFVRSRQAPIPPPRELAPAPRPVPSAPPESLPPDSSIRFTQLPPEESGIDFTYYGLSDEHPMTDQNGGGVALFDADGDGRLDVFLVNGSDFKQPAEAVGATHRLFRQTGDLRFNDVTQAAGLQAFGFGQGCTAADYDNDGFCDLFVAEYGRARLWHNNGDGTFSEVTSGSGIVEDRWPTSAAFADLDDDGHLDLYVVNYVDWSPDRPGGKRIPSPMDFQGLPDRLYRNLGDGRFEECGAEAGIAIAREGKGLALGVTDLDSDHRPDIYVANDTTRNFLFRNLGGMKFEEVGLRSGCAVSQDGTIGSGMGVAIGDFNRDGHRDLFVTNFAGEVLDAFAGLGPAGFAATNAELGLDRLTRPMLQFGIVLADFDADTWPDLFCANGHLWDDTATGGAYRMPPTLLRNLKGKRFADVSPSGGDYFQKQWLGRAVAAGDLDDDGDIDLVVAHLVDSAAILRNDSQRSGPVLRLKLVGTRTARQPWGTQVEVVAQGRTLLAHVPAGESFQASHDDRLLVPLGTAATVEEVRVMWSAGRREVWRNPPADGRDVQWLIEDIQEHTDRLQP